MIVLSSYVSVNPEGQANHNGGRMEKIPLPVNEPLLSYAPGTPERAALKAEMQRLSSKQWEIPVIIGGKEIFTGQTGTVVEPHNHKHVLAVYHKAGKAELEMAIEAALQAKAEWENMPYTQRAAIFLKAAQLLSTKYRFTLNAATMLNQSKNPHQAEIDSAAELIDFWRFNSWFMEKLYNDNEVISPMGMWNTVQHRPLEGFVFAVTPFNFTSIAGNLPTSPAIMGNTVVWKPASSVVFSNYWIMQILKEAGLPDGVINFIPCDSRLLSETILAHPSFAGVHFTGSTDVFNSIWKDIAKNIDSYHTYPRIVGETGGKDFIFAHKSAKVEALVTAAIRGSFEFQGQKCSAASRMYMPDNLYPAFKQQLVEEMKTIKMGPVDNFSNYVNAVIDKKAYARIKEYIDYAKGHADAEILIGGNCDDSVGYFIEPTVIIAKDPHFKTMEEEIFGPVLTIYVYPADEYEKTLHICDETSPYGLTGAIFAQERTAVILASNILKHAAGNFYINDKPTGAVVGQQPFGGSRASGTNDKAGSMTNLYRWVSLRTVKENFIPDTNYRYPYLLED